MRVLLATLLVSSLLGTSASGALDDPVPPVGHHVLENGTFVITEPIVIGPGSSLTIRNATVWLDFPTTCSPVGGTLGYCQPQILATGGRVRIVRSTIDTHLYDPTETLSMYAISVLQGNLQVEHSTLRHARIVGGQGDGGGLSYVGDSVIEDGFQGLSFIRGMQARVEDSIFRNLTYGVAMRDAEGAIVDNEFRFINGNGAFGRAIDVENTIAGEKAYETLVTVEGNLVEDSHQALLNLNGFPNIIRDNVFRRNVSGTTIGLSVGDTQPPHPNPPPNRRIWPKNLVFSFRTRHFAPLNRSRPLSLSLPPSPSLPLSNRHPLSPSPSPSECVVSTAPSLRFHFRV